MAPLVPAYRAVVKSKNYAFDHEPYRIVSLRNAVISIGSLSAGGAGKTPVVAALAQLLQQNGYTVDVLTRGYGRRSKAVERVDPAGAASRYGDEALMLARNMGVPVYVGADRVDAGRLAEKEQTGRHHLHLMDDGFQHRRLRRSVDVVLLTREDVRDALLPAGNLREPLENLERASVVVLREEEAEELKPFLATRCGAKKIWLIRRVLDLPVAATRPFVFCGLARPKDFFAMLRAQDVNARGKKAFGDHHVYEDADLTMLLRRAKAADADGWVTTEKDAVKMTDAMRTRLQELGPLTVAGLRVEFESPELVLRELEAMIVRDLHG
jgi:tetraacyldisaccharide 4'-kinase